MSRLERRKKKTRRRNLVTLWVITVVLCISLGLGLGSIIRKPCNNSNLNSSAKNEEKSNKVTKPSYLTKYEGPIEHIYFHPLISDTETAFKSGDSRTNDFDEWFVTVDEFKKIINSLYDKNYVLVNINDVYEEYNDGGQPRMRRKELLIEEGKKPLIISVDDLSYRSSYKGALADKLIITDTGEIGTLTVKGDKKIISTDNEIIPILENFIKKHPDFSHNNAKATLALTGDEGILGYRTQSSSPNRQSEINEVNKVVKKLKENGWTFASMGYGISDTGGSSLEEFINSATKWENEVKSLVGDTNIYMYPQGWQIKLSDEKFQYLQKLGFKIFCLVGNSSYEMISSETNAVLCDRMAVNGASLRNKRDNFLKLYDTNEVIDLESRPVR